MAPHQGFLSAFLLFLIVTDGIASPVSNTTNNVISSPDAPKPIGKQGILEIPKNVATLIRKTLEYGLQSYLNLTTPKPDPYRPASISDSIIGHYLLGNVYPRPPTHAEPYQENRPTPTLPSTLFPTLTKTETQPPPTPTPVKRKPLPSNVEKTPATKPEVQQPAPVVTAPPSKLVPDEPVANAEPAAPKAPTKIHTLDTDSSISGIFNNNGLFLNNVDGEDVYYVGPTKGSVVFPIETSTQATTTPEPAEPEQPTTEPAPSSTSEAGDEDDDGEEGFEELEFKDVKRLNKIA